jgi:superfamily II DNA or RNA helicase
MTPEILERLRPWQRKPATHLESVLQAFDSALDMSVCGSGKTYISAAVAASSRLPTLVVCPKIAVSNWHRAAAHFGDKVSVVGYEMLRTGRAPFGWWDNPDPKPTKYFQCTSCQQIVDLEKFRPCYAHPAGIHCLEAKKKTARYGKFHFHQGIRNIVFDEVHRCGAVDSLNADMLISAKRSGAKLTMLSATPASSPIGMRGIGFALDLHNLDHDLIDPRKRLLRQKFYRWASQYGVRRDPDFRGLKWFAGQTRQREIMLQIRARIIPERGIRLDYDDIPGFPQRDIQAELYDLDDPAAVDSCYQEMAAALEQLALHTAGDKSAEHPLTKILRARQQVELLKVPIFSELGQDYLDKGLSVVWFVNFRQTIDELLKRFPKAGVIDGQTGKRDEVINTFQTNRGRELIVNAEAGKESMSLQDLDGLHPRIGLVSPVFSAVVMQQIFGRLHRDGGLSRCFYRVIFANKTVEVKMHRAICPKLNNIDALTDADVNPSNLCF